MLRPEGKAGHRYNQMSLHRAEPESLRDGCQKQRGFHHCEGCANALPGAAAEWEISEPWELLRSVLQPAIRIEFLRIRKISGVALHDPWAHHNIRARRNPVTAQFELRAHVPGHALRRPL